MFKSSTLSIRYRPEIEAWLRARCSLTGRSLNAEVLSMLEAVFEGDPLTGLKITEEKGRYILASAFTPERFKSFATKSLAEGAARQALKMVGQPGSSIIDQTRKEAA